MHAIKLVQKIDEWEKGDAQKRKEIKEQAWQEAKQRGKLFSTENLLISSK
jgi:hypothetical protein